MIDLEAAKQWHSMSLWNHADAKWECLSIFPVALSEIEALRWLVEVISLYADECCNLLLTEYAPCACDELLATYKKALSDAGYGGGE